MEDLTTYVSKSLIVFVQTIAVIIQRLLGYVDMQAVKVFLLQVRKTAQDLWDAVLKQLSGRQFI